MSVIAELSIPASDFILGRALAEARDLSVELDKMIPLGGRAIPYFWVVGEGREAFDAVLEREPEISEFSVVDELDERSLYRVEWDASADTFVRMLFEEEVVLEEATGDHESWTFRLRFPDSHALSEFHTRCREIDLDITVDNLYNPIDPTVTETREMTEAQRDLIVRAYDAGYFDVPRKITLAELAEQLGISDQAVNERLRRGLSSLIGTALESDVSRRD